jgi:hypothetical protein
MEKLIGMYYKSLKKPTNINGLLLYPFMEDGNIRWEYDNQNNVSFNIDTIEGYLEQLIYDFFKLVGLEPDFRELTPKYCKIDSPKTLYITNELKSKLEKSLSKIKTIYLFDGEENFKCDSQMINWELKRQDTESLSLYVSFKIYNASIDKEPVDDIKASMWLQEFTYSDEAMESEEDVIHEATSIIYNEKNIYDSDYMYVNTVLDYYDTEGNPMLR